MSALQGRVSARVEAQTKAGARVTERWRKPIIPLEIDLHPSEGIELPDGRVLVNPIFTLDDEQVERLRLGYVCAKCFEPFEHAWPVRCNACGAPVRREQAAYFAREFGGVAPLGSGLNLNDELASLEERRRKREEAKQ